MIVETLRVNGRTIGTIYKVGDFLYIRDANGREKGHYNPSNNMTYKVGGRSIGQGNLLTLLLN